VKVLKQQASLFKNSLFARGINMYKHLRNRKDGRESIHNLVWDYAPKRFWAQKKPPD
jgi:hypothetical protein